MAHEIVDIIALIAAVLGLIPLWREKGRKLLAILFTCLLVAGAGYISWSHYQEVQDEKAEAVDLENKEDQVISLLCKGGANYEEIYTQTSFGYPNKVLDDAIDDLMQYRHAVKIEYVEVELPGAQPRKVSVRMFELTSKQACPSSAP